MAIDATGTASTNRAYPKLNTAVDAPSGKGINAMIDAIDADVQVQVAAIAAAAAAGVTIGLVVGLS